MSVKPVTDRRPKSLLQEELTFPSWGQYRQTPYILSIVAGGTSRRRDRNSGQTAGGWALHPATPTRVWRRPPHPARASRRRTLLSVTAGKTTCVRAARGTQLPRAGLGKRTPCATHAAGEGERDLRISDTHPRLRPRLTRSRCRWPFARPGPQPDRYHQEVPQQHLQQLPAPAAAAVSTGAAPRRPLGLPYSTEHAFISIKNKTFIRRNHLQLEAFHTHPDTAKPSLHHDLQMKWTLFFVRGEVYLWTTWTKTPQTPPDLIRQERVQPYYNKYVLVIFNN